MSKPKYTGIERRCQHTGSSCIHRAPPQAFRPEPQTWRSAVQDNWPEIVFGVLILLTFWIGIPWLAGMAA